MTNSDSMKREFGKNVIESKGCFDKWQIQSKANLTNCDLVNLHSTLILAQTFFLNNLVRILRPRGSDGVATLFIVHVLLEVDGFINKKEVLDLFYKSSS